MSKVCFPAILSLLSSAEERQRSWNVCLRGGGSPVRVRDLLGFFLLLGGLHSHRIRLDGGFFLTTGKAKYSPG